MVSGRWLNQESQWQAGVEDHSPFTIIRGLLPACAERLPFLSLEKSPRRELSSSVIFVKTVCLFHWVQKKGGGFRDSTPIFKDSHCRRSIFSERRSETPRREATKMEHLFTLRPNPYLVRNTYELSNHNTTETIRLVECKYSYTPTLIFSSVSSVVLNT